MLPVVNGAPIAAAEDERARLAHLDELLDRGPDALPCLLMPDGDNIELPASASALLRRLVHLLAAGRTVMVEPLERELTTQQAADLLDVSRPYLVRLLDRGEIPWTRTGTHRRVRLEDLLAYKRRRDADRRAALGELTRLSDKLGLYGRPRSAGAEAASCPGDPTARLAGGASGRTDGAADLPPGPAPRSPAGRCAARPPTGPRR
jgi:excisionase family DNA binding protein